MVWPVKGHIIIFKRTVNLEFDSVQNKGVILDTLNCKFKVSKSDFDDSLTCTVFFNF